MLTPPLSLRIPAHRQGKEVAQRAALNMQASVAGGAPERKEMSNGMSIKLEWITVKAGESHVQ